MTLENEPEFLERMYQKYPELRAIVKAISEFCEGREVTAKCPVCGEVLTVTDYATIGSLWVTCSTGCTRYHQKYNPETPSSS